MLDMIIRLLAVLLVIGAGLHGWGSLMAFKTRTPERAWSLGSAAFATFLGAFAWLLPTAPSVAMSWLLAGGCLAWVLTVGAFGRAIRNLPDPRVLYHLVVAGALIVAVAIRAI